MSNRIEFTPGRRVTVRDLVDSDLLHAGSRLRWTRPNVGQDHWAEVDDHGRIRLEDGRAYAAPSRAANEAVGSGSFDGWLAWRVVETGELLDRLRQTFLSRISSAEFEEPGSSADDASQSFLRAARKGADAGTPVTETVRDLLAHWDISSRDLAAADRVAADLENHGLVTSPNFLKVALETPVSLVGKFLQNEGDSDEAEEQTQPLEDVLEVGITLGNLLDAEGALVSVSRESSLDEAITLMLLNDYSQLPVLAGERSLQGAITWQSIARAAHAGQPKTVRAAIVPCPLYSFEDELVDILDVLQDDDFVIVRDAGRRITGIITAADVVRKYGELATPFFLVGELDQYLRRIIRDNFAIEDVRRVCIAAGHEVTSFDQMTMGDYQSVLSNPDCWARLGWPLDRQAFIKRFDRMRTLRNDLMHFNRDRVSPQDVERLRRLIGMLKIYALG